MAIGMRPVISLDRLSRAPQKDCPGGSETEPVPRDHGDPGCQQVAHRVLDLSLTEC